MTSTDSILSDSLENSDAFLNVNSPITNVLLFNSKIKDVMLAKITVNTKIDDTSFCSTCGPYFQINDILTCPRQWCTFYNFQRA